MLLYSVAYWEYIQSWCRLYCDNAQVDALNIHEKRDAQMAGRVISKISGLDFSISGSVETGKEAGRYPPGNAPHICPGVLTAHTF